MGRDAYLGYEVRTADHQSLAASIADLGSQGGEIAITSNLTVSSAITVPANVRLEFYGGALLVKGTGGSIYFQGPGIPGGPRHYFSGFAPGDVRFQGDYPGDFYPQWFGAVADDVTDCLPAFNSTIAAMDSAPSPVLGANHRKGARMRIPPSAGAGNYFLSDRWDIGRPITVIGDTDGDAGNVRLRFAAGKAGIVIHRYNTFWFVVGAGEAAGTTIKNLQIRGGYGPTTGTCTASGLNVTWLSGPYFQKPTQAHYCIQIAGFSFRISSISDPEHLTISPPNLIVEFNREVYGPRVLKRNNIQPWPPGAFSGQTVNVFGVVYSIQSSDVDYMTLTADYAGANFYQMSVTVSSLASLTAVTSKLCDKHGIDLKSRGKIENVWIDYFDGNGYNLNTAMSEPGTPDQNTNANLSSINQVYSYNNLGHGFFTWGNDSNQCTFILADASYNYGFGIFEGSFLGNVWVGPHTAFNEYGAFTTEGVTNYSTLIGVYDEGGQGPSQWNSPGSVILGGIGSGGAGYGTKTPMIAGSDQTLVTGSQLSVITPRTGYRTQTNLGSLAYGSGATLMSFASGNDTSLGGDANSPVPTMFLTYGEYGAGWYAMRYGTDQYNAAFAFTGSGPGGKATFCLASGAALSNWQYRNEIATLYGGSSAPEGLLTANPGAFYFRSSTAPELWGKFTGSGNTGWQRLDQGGVGGSGTVNSGLSGQLGYYSADGAAVSGLNKGTANQLLGMNSAAASPEYKSLQAGSNISISHAANAITISASSGSGLTTNTKTLQNTTWTNLFEITLPVGAQAALTIEGSLFASQAAGIQILNTRVFAALINFGGTITVDLQPLESQSLPTSAIPLERLFGYWQGDPGASKVTIAFYALWSLTPVALSLTYSVINRSSQTITYL